MTPSSSKVNNLYNNDLTTWSDLISLTKSNWESSAEINYDYKHLMSFTDNKKLIRYFTYLIPQYTQTNLENFIKSNPFLTRRLQSTISNLDAIIPLFRVKRNSAKSSKKPMSDNTKNFIVSLGENAKSFRLK